jgi:hypothetical protein
MKGRCGKLSSEFLVSSVLIVNPLLLHAHLSPPHELRNGPDEATRYHTLGDK